MNKAKPVIMFDCLIQTRSTGLRPLMESFKDGKGTYQRQRSLAVQIPAEIVKAQKLLPGEEVEVIIVLRNR